MKVFPYYQMFVPKVAFCSRPGILIYPHVFGNPSCILRAGLDPLPSPL